MSTRYGKRRRQGEDEEEEYDDNSFIVREDDLEDYAYATSNTISSGRNNDEGTPGVDDKLLEQVSCRLMRAIFSREFNKQAITRDSMNSVIRDFNLRGVKFNDIFRVTQSGLRNIYGMELVALPLKEKLNQGPVKKKQNIATSKPDSKTRRKPQSADEINAKTQFMLVNVLPIKYKSVLGKFWNDTAVDSVDSNITGEKKFMPRHDKSPALSTNNELILTGITILVVSIIVIAGGHISEKEIFSQLGKFGLSSNENTKIGSLNMSSKEVLRIMDKQEYIIEERKSEGDSSVTVYRIGRRTKVELKSLNVFEFIKNIYGSRFDVDTKGRTIVTLARVFGEMEEPNLDGDEDGTDHSRSQTAEPQPSV